MGNTPCHADASALSGNLRSCSDRWVTVHVKNIDDSVTQKKSSAVSRLVGSSQYNGNQSAATSGATLQNSDGMPSRPGLSRGIILCGRLPICAVKKSILLHACLSSDAVGAVETSGTGNSVQTSHSNSATQCELTVLVAYYR